MIAVNLVKGEGDVVGLFLTSCNVEIIFLNSFSCTGYWFMNDATDKSRKACRLSSNCGLLMKLPGQSEGDLPGLIAELFRVSRKSP